MCQEEKVLERMENHFYVSHNSMKTGNLLAEQLSPTEGRYCFRDSLLDFSEYGRKFRYGPMLLKLHFSNGYEILGQYQAKLNS
jgi:hypothetical protein